MWPMVIYSIIQKQNLSTLNHMFDVWKGTITARIHPEILYLMTKPMHREYTYNVCTAIGSRLINDSQY